MNMTGQFLKRLTGDVGPNNISEAPYDGILVIKVPSTNFEQFMKGHIELERDDFVRWIRSTGGSAALIPDWSLRLLRFIDDDVEILITIDEHSPSHLIYVLLPKGYQSRLEL